jgi:hypothetical protein
MKPKGGRCGSERWVHFDQNRDMWKALVGTGKNPRFPYEAKNLMIGCGNVSFSISSMGFIPELVAACNPPPVRLKSICFT